MITPPIPDNEKERVASLHNLNILDTQSEERFDRVTRIACKLFDMPIALVSLLDTNRQWFKSKQGLDANETSREISFCGHTILSDQIMVVEDATLDQRFHDNPLVAGAPNIKFYLGCPLKVKNHYNVGTLCLIDSKPRQFTTAELLIIRDLADMVESELESIHLSTTDELTELSNRRGFLEIANHVFHLCKRENKPFTLLFFDLNKFKHINDTFGHAEGDLVLKKFSQVLMNNFRNSDVVARLGGDEFCVLCSNLLKDDIDKLMSRLEESLSTIQNQDYKIEASVGAVHYNSSHHPTLESMLEDADKAMYQNKLGKR